MRPAGRHRGSADADAGIVRLRIARWVLAGAGLVALAFLLSRLRRAVRYDLRP